MTQQNLLKSAGVLALLGSASGCSSPAPLAPRPFGEAESLYQAPHNIEELIQIALGATLHVFCETDEEELPYVGSGFHIEVGDDCYIITYAHVRGWRGEWDFAVLTGTDFGRAITVANVNPETGHWSMAVGWPSMNDHWYQQISPGSILGPSPDGVIVSSGVSAPGMSGGPVLNSRGELIGIHFARSFNETRRALAQPVANLCQVAFVDGSERIPTFPLEFPERPIKTFIEIED